MTDSPPHGIGRFGTGLKRVFCCAVLCPTPYGIRGLITPPPETLTGQAPKWNLTSILADRPASAKKSPPIDRLPIAQPLPHLPFSHLQASPNPPKITKPSPHQPFRPCRPSPRHHRPRCLFLGSAPTRRDPCRKPDRPIGPKQSRAPRRIRRYGIRYNAVGFLSPFALPFRSYDRRSRFAHP